MVRVGEHAPMVLQKGSIRARINQDIEQLVVKKALKTSFI